MLLKRKSDTVDSQYNKTRRKMENNSLYRGFLKPKIEKKSEVFAEILNPV